MCENLYSKLVTGHGKIVFQPMYQYLEDMSRFFQTELESRDTVSDGKITLKTQWCTITYFILKTEVDYEDIAKLNYVEMIINETLRIKPPISRWVF